MLKPRSRSLALLAQVLRRSSTEPNVPALLNASWTVINPQIPHRNSSFVPQGVLDGQQKPNKRPSFAIAAAFEGHEDLEDDEEPIHLYGHEEEHEDPEEERARVLKEQFQRGMEKKKLWMQSLATQNLYTAIVKSVADCYAPLYAVMGLEGKCPLLAVARDEAKDEHELKTQYQPLRFDDMLTKATEQEALALLVIAQQPLLALTIVEHRDKLSLELARRSKAGMGVVLPGANTMEDENVVALGSHLRMFYSWATSVYAMCGKTYYSKLFDIYKRAQDAGVYVTANMNVQYLSALIEEKRYDEVFEFYETVTRDNLPTSVFFYRQLLYAVSMTRNVELLDGILEDMRIKGFKLRADDYLRAIRTYDDEYFLTETKPSEKHGANKRYQGEPKTEEQEPVVTTPRESYGTCLRRIQEQEDHPERFEKLVEAAHGVLALFDTMVDIDGLAPRHEHLFPRVITAAVYAQECERVPELLALHAEHADDPLHYAGVRMAVNALLLLDKPTEAWGLIRETNPQLKPHRYALVTNILDYLCLKKRGGDIITLMHDVDKLEVRGVFTVALIKRLVPTLCRSIDSVSDEKLLETMTHFNEVFRLSSEPHFGQFLRKCCYYGRLEVVKTALKQWLATSSNKHPLNGPLGLKLLEAFEGESDWEYMAEVFELIDFSLTRDEDNRKAIVACISRAYEALGQPERVKRAECVSAVAEKLQKQLRQRKSMKQQQKKNYEPKRSGRTGDTQNVPTSSRPTMIDGIPVLSSSS
ncbi:hypothetical protein L917_20182 [Phytophthora nicotianae]|uniref:Uncharacterized protein n=1 Tax=Phytophthora nicotianae TaxID=4792 RepID=W2K1T0_PHYNI|nr:hypothetical protein L917_20182 [Phytophthora nicotianae]